MGTRGRPLRRLVTAGAVLGAAMALPFMTVAPAHADDDTTTTHSDQDSVVLPSFPATTTIELQQLDPVLVANLTKVTITATVDGTVDGLLTNLSDTQSKTLGTSIEVGIEVIDAGLITPLVATASASDTITVAPGATVAYALAASDTTSEEITVFSPELLALLVGDGTIEFTIESFVNTTVSGPAPYLSTGLAEGVATVAIEYEFEPPPPPPCVDITKIDDLPDPLVVGATYVSEDGNVELTITALHEDNSFDWSSNVPIFWMAVKGGPDPDGVLFEDLNGATSGTAHAPFNENSGKFYEASHITVCYEPGDEPEVCEFNPELTPEHPDCLPPVPPECVEAKDIKPQVGETDLGNGDWFKVTNVYGEDNSHFDWESNVDVQDVWVKGGPGFEHFHYDPAVQSATGLHTPVNEANGKHYGLSHIRICYVPSEELAAPEAAATADVVSTSTESEPDPVKKTEPEPEPAKKTESTPEPVEKPVTPEPIAKQEEAPPAALPETVKDDEDDSDEDDSDEDDSDEDDSDTSDEDEGDEQ